MNYFFIENKDINKALWDKGVSKSYNAIVYGYSWYLDAVSPGWCAIISKNYDVLMPLPVKKKIGINYILQPLYTQQLGVFSENIISENIISEIISTIPEKYKYLVLNFNVFNKYNQKIFSRKTLTMHLDLIRPYKSLYKAYNSNTKRNIKIAHKQKISLTNKISPDDFIQFIKSSKHNSLDFLKEKHLKIFKHLAETLVRKKQGYIVGVNNSKGELIAATLLVSSNKKIINIFNISNKEGFEKKAMFFLFDSFFRINAGKAITFDFEGSSIPGVARFYKGFGAKTVDIPILVINRLPKIVNKLASVINLRVS